jgi:DNA polymerase III delta prime subunit
VLREMDRSFAEMFHIVPVNEPPEAEVWRMLIQLMREMERDQQCAFDLDALPLVYDLHRRFMREAAFPGKAAGFLRRLAVRHKNGKVTHADVLEEFTRQTGLQTGFIFHSNSAATTNARAELTREIAVHLKGQEEAVAAFTNMLLTFKAGLNDPARPIGTMLLLGPTGVGKTESAKALARTMFGNEHRLVRFDLNEFVDARAMARLTGTLQQPEGLLTGAVRRQPFSVVLFDEVEKAAPEVFDLLLTVLDEGRLTDSLGRVADFTNCIILLSSNLGAREARARLGFGKPSATEESGHYISAAEKFFRPEFFNRLDRIIPFRALSEPELDEIARRLLAEVQKRDGLKRRDCTLTLTEAARAQLVARGYHPQLGARALKRIVEREVVQRLAERLAATPPSLPVIARLDAAAGEFSLHVESLAPSDPAVTWARTILERESKATSKHFEKFEAFLARIDSQLEERAPAGAIEWNKISPAHAHYYFCREQFTFVERLLDQLARPRPAGPRPTMRLPKAQPRKFIIRQNITGDPQSKRLRERADLRNALSDLAEHEATENADSPLLNLYREAALLHAMLNAAPAQKAAALAFAGNISRAAWLTGPWANFFRSLWTSESKVILGANNTGVAITGPFFELFLPRDGSVILNTEGGESTPLCCRVLPAESFAAAEAILSGPRIEPTSGPVIARIEFDGSFMDYRTGLAMAEAARLTEADFRALMLSTLPLPPELAFE